MKPNQDSYFAGRIYISRQFVSNQYAFAVFDGHGPFGDKCSNYVMAHLI